MSLSRTLGTGLAATMFSLAACSPAPADPGDGHPPDQGGATGTAGAGSGATGGSGGSGTAGPGGTGGTGGADSTGGKAGSGGTPGAGGDSGRDAGGAAAGGTGGKGSGGGQGGSGGQADAGTGGGAPVSGPGCPEGAFLCEGFESYPSGAPPGGGWTREGGAYQESGPGTGVTDVDTMHVSSGEKALHVTGKLTQTQSSIKKQLDLQAPVVFVRLMMYTSNYPDSSIHSRLVSLGTERERNTYSLSTWNGVAIEKINSVYLRDVNTKFSSASFKNRWTCWEFMIDKTGGMGKVVPKIYVDSKELPLSKAGSASHGMTTDSWDPIDFKFIWLGLFGYQPSDDFDYWIDDVVVHSKRIGCPAAK